MGTRSGRGIDRELYVSPVTEGYQPVVSSPGLSPPSGGSAVQRPPSPFNRDGTPRGGPKITWSLGLDASHWLMFMAGIAAGMLAMFMKALT